MAKHKYIETPEKMWELFEAYQKDVKSRRKVKTIEGNKGFIISKEEREIPLTMDGFEVYCHAVHKVTIEHYFRNTDNAYEEYCGICAIIKKYIRADQIEGTF